MLLIHGFSIILALQLSKAIHIEGFECLIEPVGWGNFTRQTMYETNL